MQWVMAWLGNGFGCSKEDENVHNEVRNGRPSLVKDDLVHKVNKRVCDDRRFTVSDLFLHFPQIARTLLYDTVSSHLGHRQLHSMRRVYKNLCHTMINTSIMVVNMWKNSLKNIESDNNKMLYETLLDFFLQRNGTYFLNKPCISSLFWKNLLHFLQIKWIFYMFLSSVNPLNSGGRINCMYQLEFVSSKKHDFMCGHCTPDSSF